MSTDIEQALDRLERAMSALAATRGEMARGLDLALDVVGRGMSEFEAVVTAPHRRLAGPRHPARGRLASSLASARTARRPDAVLDGEQGANGFQRLERPLPLDHFGDGGQPLGNRRVVGG